MDTLNMHTQDSANANIEKIGHLFPNCLTERLNENGKPEMAIDFDRLRQELSKEIVEGPQERYQFTWPGKREAMRLANTPTNMTLRPDRESSVDFDHTENLYIEGDNLEVLKLLREDYLGKVKMIYIDPPYNTGNDFVYEDDFSETAGEFRDRSGMFDACGNMVLDRFTVNSESNGRFHTDWLNMMYPRLKVARDLLTEDGVIFISIDDNEVDNMIKIGTELFGQDNYLGPIILKSNPRGSMSEGAIASQHEYIIAICKNSSYCSIVGEELSDSMSSEYSMSDEQGAYRLLGLRMRGGFWRRSDRPKLYFPIYVNPNDCSISLKPSDSYCCSALPIQPTTNEDGTWRWSPEKILSERNLLIAKQVRRGNGMVWDIFQKDYFDREGGRRTKVKSIWDEADINYQNATVEVRELLGSSGFFNYPKPKYLVKKLLEIISFTQNDIILDFFSGSATTAHAVMQLNAEDSGHRKFIMVQLPEKTDKKSEAFKAGYPTICEIGKERIRRAGRKISADIAVRREGNLFEEEGKPLDTGFRVLKLDTSNMEDVYYRPEDFSEATLFEDNVKPDRTPEDLLFQVMLECNLPLSAKIEKKTIAGKEVFNVNDGYLIACFDRNVNETVITEVAKQKPYYFIMRDASLSSDNVADNFEQIFKAYSKDTVRKIL